jgi:WhiB family redox-sensing transcriptional regulator
VEKVIMLSEPLWRASAQCRRDNASYFFAPPHFERKEEKDAREGVARALCRACPVQVECLEYSLAVQEPHGIWGGLNELERRRLQRKRAAEAAAQPA